MAEKNEPDNKWMDRRRRPVSNFFDDSNKIIAGPSYDKSEDPDPQKSEEARKALGVNADGTPIGEGQTYDVVEEVEEDEDDYGLDYDPSGESAEWLIERAGSHPEEREAILDAEKHGKNRTTVIRALTQ